MATYARTVRQGLPRRPGGEPWPPASDAPLAALAVLEERPVASPTAQEPTTPRVAEQEREDVPDAGLPAVAESVPQLVGASAVVAGAPRAIRRGLPRVAGGEPWPPASFTPVAEAPSAPSPSEVHTVAAPTLASEPSAQGSVSTPAARTPQADASGRMLRRGLPRVSGGEPWPAVGVAPERYPVTAAAVATEPVFAPQPQAVPVSEPEDQRPAAADEERSRAARGVAAPAAQAAVVTGPRPPLPFTPTAWSGVAAASRPTEPPAPASNDLRSLLRRPTWTLAVSGLMAGLALLILAATAVLFVRWFLSLDFMRDFLGTYPGEYHLPEAASSGFPAWVQWQHFFNMFLMVLIIRTGLQVRYDKRPSAFWTPKWSKGGKGKISLSLWLHQSLDVLWLLNGVAFVILLFTSGHWMRIVPTSWEVFPNALSAALQYVSLNWPTENGWVNYNSLQQLAYFLTIFVAAPLAAITGVRMSGIWPKNAKTLNRVYPVEWARAVHFPVMLYFVVFIIFHVALVFATGALRNLNHMYAGTDVVNWLGFWIFVGSMVLIVAAWIAARPLVLAPIARLTGKVAGR